MEPPPTDPPPSQLPQYVTLYIADATFGPAKSGGISWDLNERLSQQILNGLTTALGSTSDPWSIVYTRVANYLGSSAISLYARPDPYGTASIIVNGQVEDTTTLATDDNNTEDVFFATWPGGPTGWRNVPLRDSADLRVQLQLFDDDWPQSSDAMGNPQISRDEIIRALREGRTYQVRVAEQTQNQVLFIGLSVIAQ